MDTNSSPYSLKIQRLLESHDLANFELALELTKGLGLEDELYLFEKIDENQCQHPTINFQGFPSIEFTRSLLHTIENQTESFPMSFRRRFYAVLVELMQHLHQSVNQTSQTVAIYPIQGKIYFLHQCCHLFQEETLEHIHLKSIIPKIQHANQLKTREAIKAEFKKIARHRGKDISWFEVRRNSKNIIQYRVKALNDKHTKLHLKVIIDY